MLEAVVLWNEPNNLSHWNFHLDPGWVRFSDLVKQSSAAIRSVNPSVPIVLGGVSSCDCDFIRRMASYGLMEQIDAVGVHGFPLAGKSVCRIDVAQNGGELGRRGGQLAHSVNSALPGARDSFSAVGC